MKTVAEQGCTVVATIHQPSELVFSRFDKVLLLAGGQTAYYGPIKGLKGFPLLPPPLYTTPL